jgi:hypothetical protein
MLGLIVMARGVDLLGLGWCVLRMIGFSIPCRNRPISWMIGEWYRTSETIWYRVYTSIRPSSVTRLPPLSQRGTFIPLGAGLPLVIARKREHDRNAAEIGWNRGQTIEV